MALTLITPATVPVVTLAQAKAWCRVEGSSSDALLADLLLAAQRHVEQIIGRSLGEQSWQLTLDTFSDAIELAPGPVTAVAGFTYVDVDGLTQTVNPAIYSLDLVSTPGWIVRNEGQSWPELQSGVNTVSITFTAGEGPDLCPPDLAQAIKLLVAYWFDNREAALPFEKIAGLVNPYRRIRI